MNCIIREIIDIKPITTAGFRMSCKYLTYSLKEVWKPPQEEFNIFKLVIVISHKSWIFNCIFWLGASTTSLNIPCSNLGLEAFPYVSPSRQKLEWSLKIGHADSLQQHFKFSTHTNVSTLILHKLCSSKSIVNSRIRLVLTLLHMLLSNNK